MPNTADHQHHGRGESQPAFEGTPANALPLTASEDRQFATLAHFGGILGFIPSLLIFLIFKDRGPFTAQESKEALNFTLPPTMLALVAWLLSLVPVIGAIFAVVNALIWVTITIFSVHAGIQVNRGRPYRYPLNLRLVH
ncbi:membrane protein [Arthrobacter sp. MN05-02]|nr:membrane protein [Arthrobacter sp. MN05-02]